MSNGLFVEVKQLTKTYTLNNHPVPVLHQFNLRVEPGEFIAVTGKSGAGKSTLLHLIGTLDLPTEGSIILGDAEVSQFTSPQLAAFRNQHIGFVFQFHHLLPEFTALENVMMPVLMRRETHKIASEKAKLFLTQVGLANRLHHRPGELSGGEQQRVALARALVTKPQLLLADEPTGNLDDATGKEIIELIKQSNKENGVTTIMVTHHTRFADLADRQVVLLKHA